MPRSSGNAYNPALPQAPRFWATVKRIQPQGLAISHGKHGKGTDLFPYSIRPLLAENRLCRLADDAQNGHPDVSDRGRLSQGGSEPNDRVAFDDYPFSLSVVGFLRQPLFA